jgi:hypothetical protein
MLKTYCHHTCQGLGKGDKRCNEGDVRRGAGELIKGSKWQAWQDSNCVQERATWWRGRSRAMGVLLFMEMWHFQFQNLFLFGCEVMAMLSCLGESMKPFYLVLWCTHNKKVEYNSFPMIPHLTQGSYCSWRCGTFKFKIHSCLFVLLRQCCCALENPWSPFIWYWALTT